MNIKNLDKKGLTSVLESAPVPLIITDRTFSVVYLNRKAKDLFGEDYFAAKEDSALEVFSQDLKSISSFNTLLDSPSRVLITLYGKRGMFYECELIYDKSGDDQMLHFWLNEKQGGFLKGAFNKLFDSVLEGIFLIGNDGIILEANPAAARIYNLSIDTIRNSNIKHLFPHQTVEDQNSYWNGFMKNKFIDGFYKYKVSKEEVRYIQFRGVADFLPGIHLAVFEDATERTNTGKAYRSSAASLNAIFENSNQFIFLFDLHAKIITANTKAFEWVEDLLKTKVAIGTSLEDLGRKGLSLFSIPFFEEVKKGLTLEKEYNLSSAKNELSWVEVNYFPVFENDVVQGICIKITDITERKRSQVVLEEKEARFRSLFINSSDLIMVLDEFGIIKYSSPSSRRIIQMDAGELSGKKYLSFIHPEEKENFTEKFEDILSNKLQVSIEHRFISESGKTVYVDCIFNNLTDDPYVHGIVVNMRDVSESKSREEYLLLLERAIDNSKNGVIITDFLQVDNPVIYANTAIETITGYSIYEVVGRNSELLLGLNPNQEELKRITEDKNAPVKTVVKSYKKDGTVFYKELSISPVFNKDGTLTNFIGILNDVSERIISEESLLEVSKGIEDNNSNAFYASLAEHLGKHFAADQVLFVEREDVDIIIKGQWGAQPEFPISNDLKNPFWLKVFSETSFFHYDEELKEFPEIYSTGIQNLCALPLIESSGNLIGVILLMRKGKFLNLPFLEIILNLLSLRLLAEFERDRNISALLSSEGKFRSLAENSPDIIYIINLEERKIKYFNRDKILGFSSEDLIYSDAWEKIVHPDDVNKVARHWNKYLKSKGVDSASIEYRLRHKNGYYEWINNRHVIIERDPGGKPLNVLLNITVITNRKRAEDALRENQARLTALIENTSDIVWSVNTQYHFTTMNNAFQAFVRKYFHYEARVGDKLSDIFPVQVRDYWKEQHTRALKGERFAVELQIPGDFLSFEINFNPIYSDKDGISGASVFARDITQRKKSENAIIQANFELDSFVYRASHDLRAPLRSVLGLISLVKFEENEDQRNYYLKLAEKSIDKLDFFISDLTDFSRNSRTEIEVEKIDFNATIADCIENLKYMEKAEEIDMRKNFMTNVPFYSDSRRIAIIFQNLLSNAIKYQNHKSVKPFVELSVTTFPDRAEISITDNGRGIREEYLNKVFNMFFRASQDSYGSGLGLYITKQVVEKLNGKIEVFSQFGKGTTFRLNLPNLENNNYY
ncbi:MAG: PAS domain S-box protein [Sporocytophaga sp.]|uniref:PAS domain S-box protein n=1 Tax=Sporocytophaga sp. TaxID=2231183 RepID=UPI001B040769|nr:PAS domain S-box protein [Sporocytophaga sp.]MBO9699374.1 PAS domain S-box protein [Sporocytophaga sp.]